MSRLSRSFASSPLLARLAGPLAGAVLGALALAACGHSAPAPIAAPDKGRAVNTQADSDQSRCDYKGRVDREVIETSSPGALLPNVRRVYQVLSFGDERRRVIVCREVDTNLDGVKDVIRLFNDKGEVASEEADSNYDGKIDTWLSFTGGRLSKEMRDTDYDGRPDVWEFYVVEEDPLSREPVANAPLRLQRIQRDTNHDGQPDVWEFYEAGHLERQGIDLDYDGKIDRWDHDTIARQVKADKQAAAEAASAAPSSSVPPHSGIF